MSRCDERQKETVQRVLPPVIEGPCHLPDNPFAAFIGSEKRSWHLGATMFVAFGALALVLAAIGLYSVIAYNVAQRTHELGVRVALGARAIDLVRLVVTDGVRLAALGVGIGLMIALWASKFVEPLLYDVSPRDGWIYGFVAG